MSRAAIASGRLSAEIDAQGAQLFALCDASGRDLLWDGDPAVWKGRAPILFPIIGALKDGTYRLDGKTYALPRHGFARDRLFEIVEQGADHARFRLAADAATRAVYPFDFTLEMDFRIAGATLAMTATITNQDATEMPASFGFHPAFRWPLPYGAARAAHRIVFAQPEPAPVRRLDGDGLVMAQDFASPVAGRVLPLADALFVQDAIVFDAVASRSLTYGADCGPRLEIGFPDTPQLGLWSKPGAGFVCIEPWAGHADPEGFDGDLRQKPGMMRIAPGQSRALRMRVTVDEAADAP